MCDNSAAQSFSLTNKKAYFNEKQCTDLITACGDYAKIMAETIYPWFEDIETLSRCSSNGKFSKIKAEVDKPFDQDDWNAVTTCLKTTGDKGKNTKC